MLIRFILSLLMRVLNMALRLGEKVITGIAKGTYVDPDVRKGEVLVHPEAVPPVGPVTKTITITSNSDDILHGTIKLEEKHTTKIDGTTYQYWEITKKNLSGDGYVYLRFNDTCELRYKQEYNNNTATGTLLYGKYNYVTAQDFERIAEFRPTSGTTVEFAADTFPASAMKTPAGWHNGITINEDGTSLTFAPGLVGAFDTDVSSMPWHDGKTYNVPNYGVPVYIYMVWAGGTGITNPPVTLRTGNIPGGNHHRLVAIATFGDDGKIASVQDMREVCTYDVTYTYDTSVAKRWRTGLQLYDTSYSVWNVYCDLLIAPTYTNEVVPAVLKDIPATVNVPLTNFSEIYSSLLFGGTTAIPSIIEEAIKTAYGNGEYGATWSTTDQFAMPYSVNNGAAGGFNIITSNTIYIEDIGRVQDTEVLYSKGLNFEGTFGYAQIVPITPTSWTDGAIVGRLQIAPFPYTQPTATGYLRIYTT